MYRQLAITALVIANYTTQRDLTGLVRASTVTGPRLGARGKR